MAKKQPKLKPVKKLDWSLFEKYGKDIKGIILEDVREKGFDSKRDPSESKGVEKIYDSMFRWRGGTRSLVKPYSFETPYEGPGGIIGYAVKIIHEDDASDAQNEIVAPKVLGKIFPQCVGFVKKGGHYILVNERPQKETLHQTYDGRRVVTPNDLIRAVDQDYFLNKFKPDSKEVRSINGKLAELRDKFDEGDGKLDQLDLQRYVSNMLIYAGHKRRMSHRLSEKLESSFADLAEKYLVAEDLMRLIQHDGYPWNHLGDYLIDAGDLKIGSPGMQVGCLFHESIFNKLFLHAANMPQTQGMSLEELFDKRYNTIESIKKISHHYALRMDIDKERMENAVYVGAIYGNLRLTYGTPFENKGEWEEVRRLRRASVELLEILSEKENSAKEFLSGFRELGWPI